MHTRLDPMINVETNKQVTRPLKFITVVKNSRIDDVQSVDANEFYEDMENNSTGDAESLTLADIFGDDSLSIDDDCSSSDDWISFDSGRFSSYSLDNDEYSASSVPSAMFCTSRDILLPTEHNHPYHNHNKNSVKCGFKKLQDVDVCSKSAASTANLTSVASSMPTDHTTISSSENDVILYDVKPRRSLSQPCICTFETSTISSESSRKRKQSSETHSLALSSVSELSISIDLTISTVSELSRDNKAMLEDYDHSERNIRVQSIKRQLRSMEIQHYRSKCVKSLRRSMASYMNLEKLEEEKLRTNSVMSDKRLFTQEEHPDEHNEMSNDSGRHSHTIMEILRDILFFNIFLGIVYMLCVLYKDIIMDTVSGASSNHWFAMLKGL